MKHPKRLVLPLLLCLCLLAACAAAPDAEPGITGELAQRYEPYDLRWQTGVFRALAYPADEAWAATAAGLHAVTGRLTVVYTHRDTGAQFWLECHTLNDTQAQMVRDRDMPLDCWMTNAETPESRCELVYSRGRSSVTYALALCSDTLAESDLLAAAAQVTIWFPFDTPDAEGTKTFSCTGAPVQPVDVLRSWGTTGHHKPDADGMLDVALYTLDGPFCSDGSWRMQQYQSGHWIDMALRGDGITCSDRSASGTLRVDLPRGRYRVMVSIQDATGLFTELPYEFQVVR